MITDNYAIDLVRECTQIF